MTQTAGKRTAATVRAELARRRISGRQLATDLGWGVPTMARRLNGTVAFSVDELAAVAHHLGLPVTALLADDDEEPVPV